MSSFRKVLFFRIPQVLLGLALANTFATFALDANSNISFTSGTVDVHAAPTSAMFSLRDVAPGDSRYGALTISNAGTLGFGYKLSATTTNADGKNLASQLHAEARSVSGPCDAASFAESRDTIASPGTLDELASASSRRIAPGRSEVACFKVSLSLDAGNRYQNATTTATFSIEATPAETNAFGGVPSTS